MVFDTERFIVEIENRPCIWNIHIDDYYSKEAKQRAWDEIAEIIYGDWLNCNENLKGDKIKELHKKWKGLRDYFNREKSKNKAEKFTNSPSQKRKPLYLHLLQFLKGAEIKSKTSNNNRKPQSIPLVEGRGEKPKRKKQMAVNKEASLKTMEDNLDPDMNFLLNILPDMKSMDHAQNFEFRYRIMKLIKDIKYDRPAEANFTNNDQEPYQGELLASESIFVPFPVQFAYASDTAIDIDNSTESPPHQVPVTIPYEHDVLGITVNMNSCPLSNEWVTSTVEENLVYHDPQNQND